MICDNCAEAADVASRRRKGGPRGAVARAASVARLHGDCVWPASCACQHRTGAAR